MVSFRLPGAGQRTKTFETLAEAKEHQAKVRDPQKARQFATLARNKLTLDQYFPLFLERRRDLKPSTRNRYEEVGRLYIVPGRLGQLKLSEISRDDVEFWVSDLVRTGVSVPTIDRAYRTLRVTLEQATQEGKAWSNVARRIKLPAMDRRDPFFLTADQVDAVAQEVTPRQRALVYLLAYTGLRMGEASALRIKNMDLIHGKLSVVESSSEVAGRKITGETKTGKTRLVVLPDALVVELAEHLKRYGVKTSTGELDPEAYAFTTSKGGQVRQNNWRSRVFQPACRRAGVTRPGAERLEVPRVHDLRHTAASLAAASGYSLHEVKEMLGHSTIKTTSDLYLHLFSDTQREKADALGGLMRDSRKAARDSEATILPIHGS